MKRRDMDLYFPFCRLRNSQAIGLEGRAAVLEGANLLGMESAGHRCYENGDCVTARIVVEIADHHIRLLTLSGIYSYILASMLVRKRT